MNDIHVEGVHLIHYYYAISGPEKLIGRSFLPEYAKSKMKSALVNLEQINLIKNFLGMEVVLIGKSRVKRGILKNESMSYRLFAIKNR